MEFKFSAVLLAHFLKHLFFIPEPVIFCSQNTSFFPLFPLLQAYQNCIDLYVLSCLFVCIRLKAEVGSMLDTTAQLVRLKCIDI